MGALTGLILVYMYTFLAQKTQVILQYPKDTSKRTFYIYRCYHKIAESVSTQTTGMIKEALLFSLFLVSIAVFTSSTSKTYITE